MKESRKSYHLRFKRVDKLHFWWDLRWRYQRGKKYYGHNQNAISDKEGLSNEV